MKQPLSTWPFPPFQGPSENLQAPPETAAPCAGGAPLTEGGLAGQRHRVGFQKEEPDRDRKESQRKPLRAHLGGLRSLWFLEEPRDFGLLRFNALQFKR